MLPLEGVRILAVEQYGAGPWGTQYLSDIGAEVIKLENPTDGGDMSRAVGPFFLGGGEHDNDSLFFQSLTRNKRNLTVNLQTEEGQAILHYLVTTDDAATCNLRGDEHGRTPVRSHVTHPPL